GQLRDRVRDDWRKDRRHEGVRAPGIDDRIGNLSGLMRDQLSPDCVSLGPDIFTFVVEALTQRVDDNAKWEAVEPGDDAAIEPRRTGIHGDRMALTGLAH